MPRISGIPGPYWFYFYSFDCNEPVVCTFGEIGNTVSSGWRRPNSLSTTGSHRGN